MAKILAFSGSTRNGSINQRLVTVAAEKVRALGAEVTLIDLSDYPLPIFNEDLESEEGAPENATKLFELMKSHDGLLVGCPEYNGSITPILKNTIDWLSRPREGEPRMAAYINKTCTLLSASEGELGGLRGLVHVRAILSGIGVLVLPSQVAIGDFSNVINEEGKVTDSGAEKRLDAAMEELVSTTKKLA